MIRAVGREATAFALLGTALPNQAGRRRHHAEISEILTGEVLCPLPGSEGLPICPGAFYPPTVLDHVTPGMTAFVEETFGPGAAIIRARDVDHAIELANDSEYGLGAALWTGDIDRARPSAAGSRRGPCSSTA